MILACYVVSILNASEENANACPNSMEIHSPGVDQNVCLTLTALVTELAFRANAVMYVPVIAL